ncbi:MAG: hypothetical protein P8I99_06665 [Acidimicrobiales bacterium]|nr:hypothetical protein [Acidimicrobiales bacterium]MDG1877077.1 hypothetical protein [Acidimicrobiales bacterium]
MSSAATRIGIRAFTASVTLNATLGILVLLGDLDDLGARVLITSFLVSASMLSVLINAPALRRRPLPPTPVAGAVGGAAGFALLIMMVWVESPSDELAKLAVSSLIVGGAATLAAALRLVGDLPTVKWLQLATSTAVAALAGVSLVVLWTGWGGDGVARLIGILSILVATGTLLIPVIARFGGSTPTRPGPQTISCPHCGETIERD